MKTRDERIAFHRNYCVHYERGECPHIKSITRVATDNPKITWGPCIGGHMLEDPLKHCQHWERRSVESAEMRADSIERTIKQLEVAAPVINAWRDKPPKGKSEVIECPVCKGRLSLQQSSYNGHVWARCSTQGCVSFIE